MNFLRKWKTNSKLLIVRLIDPPKFELTPSNTAVGHEGESLHLAMKADGNPTNIEYSWMKDGEPIIFSERIVSDGGNLNITKLTRNDDGIYSCKAVNSQGSATINITVIVECKCFFFSFQRKKFVSIFQ